MAAGGGEQDAKKFTVTFVIWDDAGETITRTVKENQTVAKPNDPDYPQHIFLDWVTRDMSPQGELTIASFDFDTPITEDLTLYAMWGDIDVFPITYTVTFVLCEDEGENFTVTVNANETVEMPDNPIHPIYGNCFNAWYTLEDDYDLFDFNTPVIKDITLYASWSVLVDLKPVLYLYPEQETDVTVKLQFSNGGFLCTYPDYNDGWHVKAYPDGCLINYADGYEYSYLYWEAHSPTQYDFSEGFVVRGADTAAFLRETLSYMGLTPKEYNEFIVFWLPLMQSNPYNLISFQGETYTDHAMLDITPAPDSILRVFMAYKPLSAPVEIPEQVLSPFERVGFTVVEWGGAAVR